MTPSGQPTAVLLDHHAPWLEAVELVLTKAGISVMGKATTPDQALDLIEKDRPDVLVVEPGIPRGERGIPGGLTTGLALIRKARRCMPSLKVIVLGSSSTPGDVAAAFDLGASAYVVKTAHPDDFASAIRQVLEPSVFFANGYGQTEVGNRDAPGEAAQQPFPSLTRREREILRLVAEGHSNAQLARMLWVAEQTVKFHLANIYRKVEVSNRTEASRWAQCNGLLAEPAPAIGVAG